MFCLHQSCEAVMILGGPGAGLQIQWALACQEFDSPFAAFLLRCFFFVKTKTMKTFSFGPVFLISPDLFCSEENVTVFAPVGTQDLKF